jgi:predicted translin family RNA/ssDNA-binding protein
MITKIDALVKLKPNADWTWVGDSYDGLEWQDTEQTKPTEQEIIDKQTELQNEYNGLAYARARKASYPSLQEFAEAYCEKEIGGDSTKWDAYKIAYNKVRTDNPKG